MNFLEEIVKFKKQEVERKKAVLPLHSFMGNRLIECRDFKKSIKKKGIALIAEIKRRSPSNPNIIKHYSPENLAQIYATGGVDAISVLTDKKYFGGNENHIIRVKRNCMVPVLRKEFIIDEYQIYESYYLGADAILLIVSILDQEQLRKFVRIARGLNLAAVIETHNITEIERALNAGAEIIGINNRDLKSFRVDLGTSLRLRPLIPDEIIKVSESGIKNFADIKKLRKAGFDAVLVGTGILQAKNIVDKIRELKNQEAG